MADSQSADYPAAIHTGIETTDSANSALGSTNPTHSEHHEKLDKEVIETQKKIGIGSSPASGASTNNILAKRSNGSTAWVEPGAVGLPFVIPLATISFSPADATNYFIANHFGNSPSTLTDSVKTKVYIPVNATILGVHLTFSNFTTNGSNETSTAYLRVNDTDDFQISNAIQNNTGTTHYDNPSMDVDVDAGEFIALKWTTPTWGTNPAGTRVTALVYLVTR